MIFHEWIDSKLTREEISKSTKDRYERQYEQCFLKFGKNEIKSLSEYDVENFILNAIHDFNLTAKGFSNLRTLIFGIFRLAKKKKLVDFSITELVSDIEISRKSFRPPEWGRWSRAPPDQSCRPRHGGRNGWRPRRPPAP